jgi:hypothetical protein
VLIDHGISRYFRENTQMKQMMKIGFGLSCAVLAFGCTAETAPTAEEAPDLAIEGLDESDEGTSWNGWSMSISGRVAYNGFFTSMWSTGTFSRTSGDATRGGGVCTVVKRIANPASCTSDAACTTAAQAQWGAAAYGYCFAGSCYSRTGDQATYCTTNPARPPSTFTSPVTPALGLTDHVMWAAGVVPTYTLGCMTKTAGPNTACGGSNTGLYMRSVVNATF